jgi:hypothetical protein
MTLKADLKTKLTAIRAARAGIPDIIAGVVSTETVRTAVDAFIDAFSQYVEALGERDQLCADCASIQDERQRLICQLNNCYNLTEDENYPLSPLSLKQLEYILAAMETTGRRLADLLAQCNSVPSGTYDPQDTFRDVFGQVQFGYNPSLAT